MERIAGQDAPLVLRPKTERSYLLQPNHRVVPRPFGAEEHLADPAPTNGVHEVVEPSHARRSDGPLGRQPSWSATAELPEPEKEGMPLAA